MFAVRFPWWVSLKKIELHPHGDIYTIFYTLIQKEEEAQSTAWPITAPFAHHYQNILIKMPLMLNLFIITQNCLKNK